MRDLTAPLGAGLDRLLDVEACFFNAGFEPDCLGMGRREILVGIVDGFEVEGDDDDCRVNWGAGESMLRRIVFLVRAQKFFLGG